MSNSCEIISPSRSSKTIRIEGSKPYNEGSNDEIETRPEPSSKKKDLIAKFFAGPILTDDRTSIPLSDRNIDSSYDAKIPEPDQKLTITSDRFIDLSQNSVLNKRKDKKSFKTKSEVKKGTKRSNTKNNYVSFGVSNTIAKIEEDIDRSMTGKFFVRESIFKSPPDLDLLDEMYKSNNVSIEYYSSPNKISINGLIEPLYIRETSTFEFNEKSFKADLTINDTRKRSFIVKETIPYNCNAIEHFEDNIDSFSNQQSSLINNKFSESYNTITKKYVTSTSPGKIHNNKILDTSWISNDNARISLYENKYNTMKSEVLLSNYVTLNNDNLMAYYSENNITIGNEYPKIFEDKYSTGYTYDRSKVQGLDSISFGNFLE